MYITPFQIKPEQRVLSSIFGTEYAKYMVMVVDQIGKAGDEHACDPLGALYSLLEHDTAGSFTDEFAEVPIDASQVVWVATANDGRAIPDPIRNRMNVYEPQAPDRDAARRIAARLYTGIRTDHDWSARFEPEPGSDVLEAMGAGSARNAPCLDDGTRQRQAGPARARRGQQPARCARQARHDRVVQ